MARRRLSASITRRRRECSITWPPLRPFLTIPFALEEILTGLPTGSQAARAAIDMCLHDLVGRRLGLPLYQLWGLNPARAPETSFTIGLGPIEEVRDRFPQGIDQLFDSSSSSWTATR